jgi:hypothetical protein
MGRWLRCRRVEDSVGMSCSRQDPLAELLVEREGVLRLVPGGIVLIVRSDVVRVLKQAFGVDWGVDLEFWGGRCLLWRRGPVLSALVVLLLVVVGVSLARFSGWLGDSWACWGKPVSVGRQPSYRLGV